MRTISLFGVLLLTAIAVSAQRPIKSASISDLLINFESSANGLTFLSETDADVHNFVTPLTTDRLTAPEFLRVNVMPADTTIAVLNFDEWVDHQMLFDRSRGWQRLRANMAARLSEIVVFKVGIVQIQYFAVGIYRHRMIGVRTFGVST